jgi:hypothetical protein
MLRCLRNNQSARTALKNSLKRTRPGLQVQAPTQAIDYASRSHANHRDGVVFWPLTTREFSSNTTPDSMQTSQAQTAQTQTTQAARNTRTPAGAGDQQRERELKRLTDRILYTPQTPLGTMTVDQWDDTLLAMLYWFHHDSNIDVDALQEDGAAVTASNSLENVPVTGFVLDIVDRLLHRLYYEHATQSVASRNRNDDLAQWTLAVLSAWLRAGQNHPTDQLSVQRADKLWAKIVQWKERGLWKQGNLPVPELAQLAQAWLKLQSPQGTQKAAELLLSVDMVEFVHQGNHAIIPCYHQALEQSVQFAESCGDLSSKLVGRMEKLSREPGWEAIQPSEEVVQARLLDDFWQSAPDNQKALSSFETQTLQRNMLKRIHEAFEDDMEKVDDVIERWKALEAETDPKLTNELTHALYGYYVRIEDPRKATSWLLQLDQTGVPDDEQTKQFEKLIRLWSESKLPDACWRLEELLPRLEELTLQDGSSIDTSVYTSIARLMLDSGAARGTAKARALVSRAKTLDASLLRISLDACLLEGPTVSVDSVMKATRQFMQLYDTLDETEALSLALDTILLNSLAHVQKEFNAIKILSLVEEKFLTLDRVSAVSPVPLASFKSVISALAAKEKLLLVAQVFDRVWTYYHMGYTDLLPDADLYMLYLTALAKEGESTLDKREELLNQLIQVYGSSGKQECKPSDRMFNYIYSPTTKPTEEHVQRAVVLLDELIEVGAEIQDPKPFNTIMHLITENQSETVYKRVIDIHERMQKAGVPEDTYTLHNIVRACGRAQEQERPDALNLAMATLGEIRYSKQVDTRTYSLVFRVVGELLPSRDAKMLDPLVEAIFKLCCDDGHFSSNTRKKVKDLMSEKEWKKSYERYLDGKKKEPKQWSRNVGIRTIEK